MLYVLILLAYFTGYNISQQSGRKFMAWQTWDLLRLMYFGFRQFCCDFLSQHPGYAIYPIRLNGSAVETLFSQLKHAAGGHLSSINYSSARASIITRRAVHKTTSDDYRQAPLFIRQDELQQIKK